MGGGYATAALISILLAVGVALPAYAQDARVAFLTKQLQTAKDPRVRAQTAVILGASSSQGAITALCGALSDGEAIVRSAAINALADLRRDDAYGCLKRVSGEPHAEVRAALSRALALSPLRTGALYVAIDPVADKAGAGAAAVALTEGLLRTHLSSLGAAFAPRDEPKAAAQNLVKSRKLKGYSLRASLLPNGDGLKLEILVMTYPDQALQGSWNVKARGAKPDGLLRKMVPHLVNDAAMDLDWKSP